MTRDRRRERHVDLARRGRRGRQRVAAVLIVLAHGARAGIRGVHRRDEPDVVEHRRGERRVVVGGHREADVRVIADRGRQRADVRPVHPVGRSVARDDRPAPCQAEPPRHGARSGPAVQLQLLPVGVRHWKPVPEPALIIMCAYAEFEARLSRSMMPAFDQASAHERLVTRATNWKSPETGTYA